MPEPTPRPRIGIPAPYTDDRIGVPATYVEAITLAGGLPLILPPLAAPEADEAAQFLAGLLIPGGDGITVGLVGELPADLPPVDARRWQSDVALFKAMQARERPILGICYGMQLINACYGGTIYADVQAQRADTRPHAARRGRETHTVYVKPDAWLMQLLPDQQRGGEAVPVEVNSAHVQAVQRVGAGLRISARADDGLVEGIDAEGGRVLGVQWHPERLTGPLWRAFFAAFVRRCAEA